MERHTEERSAWTAPGLLMLVSIGLDLGGVLLVLIGAMRAARGDARKAGRG